MSYLRLSAVTILSLFLTTHAFAHGGHASAGGGGLITTMDASTMAQGEASLSLETSFTKMDEFADAELIARAGQHIHVHGVDNIISHALGLSYGLTDSITVSAALPFAYRNNIRSGHHSHGGGIATNTAESYGNAAGIGDAIVAAKIRLLREEEAGIGAALIAALKIPTGETHLNGDDGERLDTEFQPGTGSWDKQLGVAVSKTFGKWGAAASLSYSFAGEGSQSTDLGDHLSYNIGASYRLSGGVHEHEDGDDHFHPAWDAMVELSGQRDGRITVAGEEEEDTGVHEIFLSPGLRYTAEHNAWSAQAAVGVPVFSNVGTGEAKSDYRVLFSISKGF